MIPELIEYIKNFSANNDGMTPERISREFGVDFEKLAKRIYSHYCQWLELVGYHVLKDRNTAIEAIQRGVKRMALGMDDETATAVAEKLFDDLFVGDVTNITLGEPYKNAKGELVRKIVIDEKKC